MDAVRPILRTGEENRVPIPGGIDTPFADAYIFYLSF